MAASCTNVGLALNSFATQNKKLDSKILDRYFNHGITMILPGCTQIPDALSEILEEQMSYSLTQLPLFRLIEVPFIQAFVKKGKIYVLSKNTKLDCHDCVAITPTGVLVLHLTKDTYLSLGLEASKQTFMNKRNEVYTVKINLLDESFHPKKSRYDRLLHFLQGRQDLIFDFHIAWVPHDPNICSSSIGIYFSDICQEVKRFDLDKSSAILTSLRHPQMDVDDPEGEKGLCHYEEVFEWMGALALGIECHSDMAPSYASSYMCPDPNENCPRCLVFQASGFLPSYLIHKIYKELSSLPQVLLASSQQLKFLPLSLTVHGVKDSPVTRKVIPRDFSIPGDNLYSLLLFPEYKCWLLRAGDT